MIAFGFVRIISSPEMEVVERLGNVGGLEIFGVSRNAFLLPVLKLESIETAELSSISPSTYFFFTSLKVQATPLS